MRLVRCPDCGLKAIKYGVLKSGTQRWYCQQCKVAFVAKADNKAKNLKTFLSWLFGKAAQSEMPGQGRTFRRKAAQFWSIWPLPPKVETARDVVYVDGIYLSRKLCVLICCDDQHVLGWYVCRSENTKAWIALLERLAPPTVVVSDGGAGFASALRKVWPQTQHQRCLFHAFCQVKHYTTGNPKTPAGRALYAIAKGLFKVKTTDDAHAWIVRLLNWRKQYNEFLKQMTTDEYGNKYPTHQRLLNAENSLNRLIRNHTLFTFLEVTDIEVPHTTNRIEGGINAQLRAMLRNHRGLSLERRLKAVYWWCYMHSPRPLPAAEILSSMPTDQTIADAYQRIAEKNRVDASIPQWGSAVAWNELHMSTPFPTYWD